MLDLELVSAFVAFFEILPVPYFFAFLYLLLISLLGPFSALPLAAFSELVVVVVVVVFELVLVDY